MTAVIAVPLRRGGEKKVKEGNEGQVVKTLAQILRSVDPENTFLRALYNGAIPDEICLELAEHLGELVKATNFDNRIKAAFTLCKGGAISKKTKQYLLLAILEMDEQEETEVEVGDELTKITVTIIPPVTKGQVSEPPTAAPQAPPADPIIDLVRSVTELQVQFGTNLPEEKWLEIGQIISSLSKIEFSSLRQFPCSAILAQAEPGQHRIDIAAALEVVEIVSTAREIGEKGFAVARLLGRQQAELTSAAFAVYEVLVREGFRLTLRNEHGWPLMVVASITLLRNRFQRWLDFHKSNLGEGLVSAEKIIATLEGLVLAVPGDEDTKEVIRHDQANRLRERIVSSRIRALDKVSEELVAAQPTTKEEALQQVRDYLHAKQSKLASELRAAGSAILGEADATILQIFNLHLATTALRNELAELKASNYNPLAQRPVLSGRDKQLVVYELERKELVSIYDELEAALEEGSVTDRSRNRNRKKLQILLVVTASKLQELDQLIAGLRPAPTLEVHHG